jgi:hypothetical protein
MGPGDEHHQGDEEQAPCASRTDPHGPGNLRRTWDLNGSGAPGRSRRTRGARGAHFVQEMASPPLEASGRPVGVAALTTGTISPAARTCHPIHGRHRSTGHDPDVRTRARHHPRATGAIRRWTVAATRPSTSPQSNDNSTVPSTRDAEGAQVVESDDRGADDADKVAQGHPDDHSPERGEEGAAPGSGPQPHRDDHDERPHGLDRPTRSTWCHLEAPAAVEGQPCGRPSAGGMRPNAAYAHHWPTTVQLPLARAAKATSSDATHGRVVTGGVDGTLEQ